MPLALGLIQALRSTWLGAWSIALPLTELLRLFEWRAGCPYVMHRCTCGATNHTTWPH